jgi:two-component system, NarL family, response regulator NreC
MTDTPPMDRGPQTGTGSAVEPASRRRFAYSNPDSTMAGSDPAAISILICDDHILFREGVKAVLGPEPDIEVSGEAGNAKEAVELALRLRPNVVLLDVAMPLLNGFDALPRIRRASPESRVLILTDLVDDDVAARCLHEGAMGYVLKDTPPEQLVYAIRAVYRGDRYLSPRVLTSVVRDYISQSHDFKSSYNLLSDREREVLVLLAQGNSLKEIAYRLNLSVKTVDAHKYKIMRKLDLHDRSELIRYAIRKGLVQP